MTFEEARAAFPVLERLAYLNAGTCGPLARGTMAAMAEVQRQNLNWGRGGLPYFEAINTLRARVREAIAALIDVPPDAVALTTSTTEACQIVFAGLELGPADEVVVTDVEHFGLLGPAHASGARVRVARVRDLPSEQAFDAIAAEVTPKTRLLALSHVAWSTGHVLPVHELKQETGLPLLVDGAQSVGAVPVAARAFDFYTVSAQKWLCGPDSTGALYVADPESLAVAAPSYFSQDGYEPDGSFTPRAGALRFERTWIPPWSLAGLAAAMESAPPWRFERAADTAERCRRAVGERFSVVTEAGHATLVTFRVAGDARELAGLAYERGVVLRDLPGTGWLRASCGYWTSDEDIERLVTALP